MPSRFGNGPLKWLGIALAGIATLALGGCYGIDGHIRFSPDDDEMKAAVSFVQWANASVFDGDKTKAKDYVAARFDENWTKEGFEGDDNGGAYLTRTTNTPFTIGDKFGSYVSAERKLADEEIYFDVTLNLEMPPPPNGTEIEIVRMVLEWPEAWAMVVKSNGGADLFPAPSSLRVETRTPGSHKVNIWLTPPHSVMPEGDSGQVPVEASEIPESSETIPIPTDDDAQNNVPQIDTEKETKPEAPRIESQTLSETQASDNASIRDANEPTVASNPAFLFGISLALISAIGVLVYLLIRKRKNNP